jgi:hypothetical protein
MRWVGSFVLIQSIFNEFFESILFNAKMFFADFCALTCLVYMVVVSVFLMDNLPVRQLEII